MTPEAQRIAIAETCGWKEIRCHPKTKVWFAIPPPERRPQHDVLLPDYLNDLNAMHEAENCMSQNRKNKYESILNEVACRAKGCNTTAFDLVHVTAAKRAEAFLRTIGKWEEPKP